jgi:hypothetical protein
MDSMTKGVIQDLLEAAQLGECPDSDCKICKRKFASIQAAKDYLVLGDSLEKKSLAENIIKAKEAATLAFDCLVKDNCMVDNAEDFRKEIETTIVQMIRLKFGW